MRKPKKFGPYSFRSQTDLIAAIRAILHRYGLKQRVTNPEEARFLNELFKNHPEYVEKVAGRTISHFEVHPYIHGSRCFFVIFYEGGMIDFSFKPVIRALRNK